MIKSFRFTKVHFVVSASLCLLAFALLPSAGLRRTSAAGTISGRVFQDFNGNGTYDTAAGFAVDSGVAGVAVRAYDASGILRGTATTAASGIYSLAAAGSGPYRVEFTALPAGYQNSARSTNSVSGRTPATAGPAVQFVPDGMTGDVNLAVNRPVDYCQNNPLVCLPEHYQGDVTGGALMTFPNGYGADGDGNINSTSVTGGPTRDAALAPTAVALNSTVGTLFGAAWNRNTNNFYSSAYVKRNAKLGALSGESTGAVYIKNNPASATPAAAVFVDLNAVYGANVAGDNPHPNATASWSGTDSDSATVPFVGKTGLGDLKLSQDGSTLYAVNLADRNLYIIPTTGPLNSSTITRVAIPTSGVVTGGGNCPAADVRPFALGRDVNGEIYVGAVCSAESVTAAYLQAMVWKYSGGAFTVAATTSLNYSRKLSRSGTGLTFNYPWTAGDNGTHPELMLTEIEFDQGNNMILGLRDKNGDESIGSSDRSYGDLLRAAPNGSTWTFESNGTSGGVTTAGAGTFGPGGGEYYINYNADNRNEGSQGGLLQIPGFNYVETTAYDAVAQNSAGAYMTNFYTGGVQRYNNTTGVYSGAYDVFLNADPNTFRKANGLGDLEALCDKAPIEIGNRVWRDANGDGVQTPGETGIAGVTVQLYDSSNTLIGTAVTDAGGEYYFSSASGSSTGSAIYGLNLLPNAGYTIRLDNPANYASGNPLAGLALTAANASTQAGFADGSDSDGVSTLNPTGSPAGVFPVVNLTTGGPGQNNHDYDFGFRTGVTAAPVEVGGRVLDNRWKGISGARVTLADQSGRATTVTTNAFGYFMFREAQGQSAIVTASAKGRTFSQPSQFVGLTQSVDDLYFIADR